MELVEKIVTLFVGIASGINLLTGALKDIQDIQDIQNNKKRKRRPLAKKKRRH